jgi:O-acetyl-ADP-ribose deacetylase (regulator of RNase III)
MHREREEKLNEYKGEISGCPVSVSIGYLEREKAGAYLVPHFDSAVVKGGVAGSIARGGAELGIDEFADYMDRNGPLPFGTVRLTKSYGGNAEFLCHAVSVQSGEDTAFQVIHDVTLESLRLCGVNGISRLVVPALGTGILRELTDEQSAKAMLSAVHDYAREGGGPVEMAVVLYAGGSDAPSLFRAFSEAVKSKSYETAAPEKAAGEIDPGRWAEGMERDRAANEDYARKNPVKVQANQPIKVGAPLKLRKPGT